MAYKALYRTYRPQSFKDVIGQEVIVKTLQNALNNNRVSHAYLFCGPRGTGKTTIARLFAKALNCNDFNGEPCNACQSCIDITEGINPDVIEIDAASNNSVDEIRDLKDKIKYLPAGSKYKIYIIDEVHMLTTSAFNALLKTLEEPPKHAIFILATTEPQKVLPTIISRCQRFDFSSLTENELLEALENICINENVDYDKEALIAICKASDGGLRDAISFLDQAISLSDNKITEEVASSVTGLLSKSKLYDLTKYIENKNVSDAILTIQELQNEGKEVGKIINSLLGFYRDILLCKTIPEKFDNEFIDLSNSIELNKVYFDIDVLSDVQGKIKFGNTPDIYLEVAIIKMINTTKDELDYSKRISELEEKLASGVIESNGSSESMNVEDLKRIKLLEVKLNNLLTELSKLNLPGVIDTVKKLSENKNNENTDLVETVDNNKIKEMQSQIDKFTEEVTLLKAVQQGFRTELDNTRSGDVNEQLLIEKIELALKNTNKVSVNMDEVKDYVKKEMESIKFDVKNVNVISNNNEDINNDTISNMEERLSKVESNVYKILAGMLSPKPNPIKKKDKVNDKQVSLWKDEIIDVDKVSNQTITENVDFKDLAKEETPLDRALREANEEQKLVKEEIKEEVIVEETPVIEENIEETDSEENGNLFGETEFEAPEEKEEESFESNDSSWYNSNNNSENETINVQENNENLFSSNVVEDKIKENDVEESDVLENNNIIIEENPIEESIRLENETNSINNEIQKEETNNEVIEEVQEVIEETIEVEEKVEKVVDLDEYERFDSSTLLRIFNDSQCKEYRPERERLVNLWKHLTTLAPVEMINVAGILREGEIKAIGNHEFLLVYDDVLVVNQVISRKFKKQALKLLHELLDGDYNYFVLPRDIYTIEAREYADAYYRGERAKSLSPINDSRLYCDTNEDEENDMTKKAKELFGDDLIIKKKVEN